MRTSSQMETPSVGFCLKNHGPSYDDGAAVTSLAHIRALIIILIVNHIYHLLILSIDPDPTSQLDHIQPLMIEFSSTGCLQD